MLFYCIWSKIIAVVAAVCSVDIRESLPDILSVTKTYFTCFKYRKEMLCCKLVILLYLLKQSGVIG